MGLYVDIDEQIASGPPSRAVSAPRVLLDAFTAGITCEFPREP